MLSSPVRRAHLSHQPLVPCPLKRSPSWSTLRIATALCRCGTAVHQGSHAGSATALDWQARAHSAPPVCVVPSASVGQDTTHTAATPHLQYRGACHASSQLPLVPLARATRATHLAHFPHLETVIFQTVVQAGAVILPLRPPPLFFFARAGPRPRTRESPPGGRPRRAGRVVAADGLTDAVPRGRAHWAAASTGDPQTHAAGGAAGVRPPLPPNGSGLGGERGGPPSRVAAAGRVESPPSPPPPAQTISRVDQNPELPHAPIPSLRHVCATHRRRGHPPGWPAGGALAGGPRPTRPCFFFRQWGSLPNPDLDPSLTADAPNGKP